MQPNYSHKVRRGVAAARWAGAALALAATPAGAIVTSNTFQPVQRLVGAERFYNSGFFGFNVVIANIEAGHVWDRHEVFTQPPDATITYVQDLSLYTLFPQFQYDYHATAVGSILTGLGPYQPGLGYYYYQFGMAPGAALISSAIATEFLPGGEFDISDASFNTGYLVPMRDGALIRHEPFPGFIITVQQQADVVNSSWGFEDPTGTARETMMIDALIASYRQTVCLAVGNHTGAVAQVGGPASGWNSISVGALTSDRTTPPYRTVAAFSNVGPNDFRNPKTGLDIPAVRAAVDIVAPGTDIVAAAYTGSTGTFTGEVDPYPNQTNLYWIGLSGTSFASPIVAGGAALMIEAARYMFPLDLAERATDTLTVKAVLLNSAAKIPGWNNHTTLVGGVWTTYQGLDYASGAGALDLNAAYDQLLSGVTDVPGLRGGTIAPLGWDWGRVHLGTPNDYVLAAPLLAGDTLTATLDWIVHRTLDATYQASEQYFNDLDLQLWSVTDGQLDALVAESAGLYNNVEHLHFVIPADGRYALRVVLFDRVFDIPGNSPAAEDYALAWRITPVPEPSSLMALVGVLWLVRRRRRNTGR
jgi:subtilisin family serine protease